MVETGKQDDHYRTVALTLYEYWYIQYRRKLLYILIKLANEEEKSTDCYFIGGIESTMFGNILTLDCQCTCCTLNMNTKTVDVGKKG